MTKKTPTRRTITIDRDLFDLLISVAQDAIDLLQCNCVSPGCDGSCTYATARKALDRAETP
jgi:hypothetical protein